MIDNRKQLLVSSVSAMAFLIISVACSAPPEVREVEVTREVPVAHKIPVTVETVKTVEVTREVSVGREVPVTVEVVRTVAVPQTVGIPQTVEVTREVLVTRIVADTPAPTMAGTLVEPPTATPAPAPTLTATPTVRKSRFGSWQMGQTFYGSGELLSFRNAAVDHETVSDAPILTFLCHSRGYRSMYIDWHHPVLGSLQTSLSRYTSDPFEIYRHDNARSVLADYARQLHKFVSDVHLSRADRARFEELWRDRQEKFDLDKSSTPSVVYPNDPQEDEEVGVNRGPVLVELEFGVEIPEAKRGDWYRPPISASIISHWRALSNDRTLMGDGPIGELKMSYLQILESEETSFRMMTATIKEPEQIVPLVAKWEISGLLRVMDRCKEIRG